VSSGILIKNKLLDSRLKPGLLVEKTIIVELKAVGTDNTSLQSATASLLKTHRKAQEAVD